MPTIYEAFRSLGLAVDSVVLTDGIHRCGTVKKPRGKNGWYVIFDNGLAACYGNFELGDDQHYWHAEGISKDYEAIYRPIQQKIQKDTSPIAAEYFESLPKIGFSEYLKKKCVHPHGARFDERALVIPLQDAEGKIWSHQKIYPDGSKYFMQDGRVKGCYFPIFPERNIAKDELVVVCEGFATGASIYQETELPVIVAMNAGNLKAVCDSIPFRNLLIAADNDESGVGEAKAKETGYPYVMPNIIKWDFSTVLLSDTQKVADYFKAYLKKDSIGSTLKAHGLVGEIADWITATAICPQPQLSIAAALAFVGMIKGHRYATSTNLRSNMLILCLAPSASGKEHPQSCIIRLLKASGLNKHLLGEPTSGTGFLTGLVGAERIGLLVMDEIGRYLANAMNKDAQGFQKEIIDYILKTFSRANGTLVGKQYGNPKINPRIDIENPHFCCLGSTVKEKMIAACRSSDMIDGFLNRWVLFHVEDRPDEIYTNYSEEIPQALIDKINQILPIEKDAYGNEVLKVTRYTPEASDIMTDFKERIRNKIAASEFPFDSLYGRSRTHAAKIAMVVAEGDYIDTQDVLFAIKIVEQSNEAILKFGGLISDNQFEADYIRVRELIAKYKTITKNQLTRKTQFINGGVRRRDEITRSLVESNIIAEQIDGKKTCFKFIS